MLRSSSLVVVVWPPGGTHTDHHTTNMDGCLYGRSMVRPTTTTAHFIRVWWCTNIRPPTITYMGLLSSADPFVHHSACWTVAHLDETARSYQ